MKWFRMIYQSKRTQQAYSVILGMGWKMRWGHNMQFRIVGNFYGKKNTDISKNIAFDWNENVVL